MLNKWTMHTLNTMKTSFHTPTWRPPKKSRVQDLSITTVGMPQLNKSHIWHLFGGSNKNVARFKVPKHQSPFFMHLACFLRVEWPDDRYDRQCSPRLLPHKNLERWHLQLVWHDVGRRSAPRYCVPSPCGREMRFWVLAARLLGI